VRKSDNAEILSIFKDFSDFCIDSKIQFISIGEISNPLYACNIADVLTLNEAFNCSCNIGKVETGMIRENIRISAETIKRLAHETPQGLGNFQFCASANCNSGIPFFPAGFHLGETSFSIGLECSDYIFDAFAEAGDYWYAEEILRKKLNSLFIPIEKIAKQIALETGIKYAGIDTSTAPGIKSNESLAFAFEKLGLGRFGSHGTLAISSIVTKVIKSLDVETCGYAGLMLPVLEDFGLSERATDNSYNLQNLLLYSTVCGCGYDTIPIPGNTPEKTIENMLLDIASLGIRLDKPLAARIFPIPGKNAGEMTNFNSPYLVNCRIFQTD
ncbi:MAG: DUF711 family protein, partial [Planctomycetes bacterium]|nr:DUF711 family protein [Planctomycetota bacterium]